MRNWDREITTQWIYGSLKFCIHNFSVRDRQHCILRCTILFTLQSALPWPRRRNETDIFSSGWRLAQFYTARGDYFKHDLSMERRRKLSFALTIQNWLWTGATSHECLDTWCHTIIYVGIMAASLLTAGPQTLTLADGQAYPTSPLQVQKRG